MLKFVTLSLSQKRFIVAAMRYVDGNTITLKECQKVFDGEFKHRKPGTKKIGFPNWLLRHKVEKGVYPLPRPTATEMEEFKEEEKYAEKQKQLRTKSSSKTTKIKAKKNANKIDVVVPEATDTESDKEAIETAVSSVDTLDSEPEETDWTAQSNQLERLKKSLNIGEIL